MHFPEGATMRLFTFSLIIIILSAISLGCSGINPLTPTEQPDKNAISRPYESLPIAVTDWNPDGSPSGGQGFLGLFSVDIDPANMKGELTPLRSSALTDVLEVVDITNFLTLAPCVNCAKLMGMGLDASGNLVLRIGVKHPFPAGDPFKPITGRNRADIQVFNVEGIILADDGNSMEFPGLTQTIENFQLVNADGYTGYLDSQIDAIFPTTATIHPYILHFDDYSQGNFDPSNAMGFESVTDPPPTGNLIMAMGCDYDVKDYVLGKVGTNFHFAYAVGCTYGVSCEGKSQRFQPEYRIPQHLKKAASEVHVNITRNELMAGDPSSEADIEIDVVDKSHGVAIGDARDQMHAQSDVASIIVDIPGILSSTADVSLTPIGGTGHDPSDPLAYVVTIENELSASEGSYLGLVKVADSYPVGNNSSVSLQEKDGIKRVGPIDNPLIGLFDMTEFATYQVFSIDISLGNSPPVVDPVTGCARVIAGHPFEYKVTAYDPNTGQTLTYRWDNGENTPGIYDDATTLIGDVQFTFTNPGNYKVDVQVDDGFGGITASSDPLDVTVLPDGVFVDADNTIDPGQNGTWDHPWDSIQKGIDNASSTGYIYVFPATAHYATFTIKANQTVMGFDPTCGLDRPILDMNSGWTFASGVSSIAIESIIFNFDINNPMVDEIDIMYLQNLSKAFIRNCRFTGNSEAVFTYVLKLENLTDSAVEDCEFVTLRADRAPNNFRYIMCIQGSGCNTFTVMHNEFHDVGIPDLGPEVNWTGIYGMTFGNTSTSITIKNNLFYNFWDYSPAIPQPSGDMSNVIHAMSLGNTSNMEINHNTIDNFDCNNGDSTKNAWTVGLYVAMVDGVLKNNVFKSEHYYVGPMIYHNSAGFWADSADFINADYCDVYWGDPPPPPPYQSQCFSYLNRISKGVGSYDQNELIDPDFDYTPGANYYHPMNTIVATGAEDGSEMGCFGGPDGDWTPPSQIY